MKDIFGQWTRQIVGVLGIIWVFIMPLQAQSPYKLTWKGEISIGVSGFGLHGINYLIDRKTIPFTETQLSQLNPSRVPKLDRISLSQWHPPAAKVSDALLIGSVAVPFLPLLDKNIRQDWKAVGVMGLETFLVNTALTNFTKVTIRRARPYAYNSNAPLSERMGKDARHSFISGHTSTVASMSFFAAQVYQDYHPNSKGLPFVWGTAAALPALTAYLRIRAGKHFPTDVLTGYLIGTACGILIPKLHKK